MKTTHLATLPCGAIAKRVSASRVYPFVLAGRLSYDHALRHAKDPAWTKGDRDAFKFYAEEASREPGVPFTVHVTGCARPWSYDKTLSAQEIARSAERVAGHTAETYAQERQADRAAKVEADKAAGVYNRWSALTWTSRRELAAKAQGGMHGYAEFRILETERS